MDVCEGLDDWLAEGVVERVCVRLPVSVSLEDCDWLFDAVALAVPLSEGDCDTVRLADCVGVLD